MLIPILGAVGGLIALFLIYVASRKGTFRYERSGLIKAPPEKIFPYISQFKLGGEWSPFERADPTMVKRYHGTDGTVGAVMEFEGSPKAGSGKLELVNVVPLQRVDIKLTMLKPFKAENLVEYLLTPADGGTRFTWVMSGDGGFMGKLMNVLIDCEKMVGGQFEQGITNLKNIFEKR